MRYITLELAKRHLNVEHSEDDAYIEHLITVSEISVENFLERPLEEIMTGGFIPADLKHGMLLLLGTLYNNRESVVFTSIAALPALALLLQPYKKYR